VGMSESQQSKEQSHLLLNILLIVLETFFVYFENDSDTPSAKNFVDKKIHSNQ
jgi:hypothetical protein